VALFLAVLQSWIPNVIYLYYAAGGGLKFVPGCVFGKKFFNDKIIYLICTGTGTVLIVEKKVGSLPFGSASEKLRL
jgi:hypothetical protein